MKKILVVEDESAIRNLLRRHLSDDYEIVEAGDAARGLALALEQKPDCILLDLNLPDLGGFELCEMFARINTTRLIPIIVITGEPSETFRALCLSLGAADYVEKPVNFPDLKARVAAVLAARRSERRREPRVRLSMNLKLVGRDSQGNEIDLQIVTYDVSVSGFSSVTAGPLEVGTAVQVFLTQGGIEHSVGKAVIVRVESKGTPRQCFGFVLTEKTGQWILK